MIPDKKIFDLSDRGLLLSVRDDDQTAFKEIYKRYWSKLFIYCYNVLHKKDVCEDIIQEVFADLWTRKKSLHIENVSAYLYQAVKFQIFKQFRQRKLIDHYSLEFDNFISDHKIEETLEYSELHNRVDKLISELPEQRRIIFKLSRNEELSNKEIASQLQISIQTVKNQISNALKSIRKSIKSFSAFLL